MHFETKDHPPQPGGLKITIVEKRADGTCRISVYTAPLNGPEQTPPPIMAKDEPKEKLVALAS